MQKWCPEPLLAPAAGPAAFECLSPAAADARAAGFRPEAGFADGASLLASLSREERAQVVKLLEQDLRREFDERLARESAEREQACRQERDRLATTLSAWQDELASRLEQAVRSALAVLASRSGEIAVLMAEKVVRREVSVDPEILVRNLETVLYKAEAGCMLSVTVHPEDAAWLDGMPDLRERLRIAEVKEDRRLERGGCLVRADDVEWDATIARQLATLGETLAASLAIPAAAEPEQRDA